MSNLLGANQAEKLPLTEEQLIQLWITSKKSAHTKSQYLRYLNEFREAVRTPLNSITGKAIEIYLQLLYQTGKYRPATIALRLAAIKSFYRYLLKSEVMTYNPSDTVQMDNIKENKTNKTINYIRQKSLPALEINELIYKLDGLDKLIVSTLYFTGVRVSELININLNDFSFRGGNLTLTITGKGNKSREILVPQKLREIFKELGINLTGNAFLLETKDYYGNRRPYSRGTINYRLKNIAKKYGIDSKLSPHWFRHSHATNALLRGANLREIQQQLGHSSLNTTQQYLDATELGNSGNYL